MSDVEQQIIELKKTVAYDSKDYTIEILVKKYLEGVEDNENEIYVPEYQREFVWDNSRQSRLIESIVLGLPIPPIFVAENKDGRLEIVDGSQRVRTLSAFLNNELRLDGLEKVTMLNGMAFDDFDVSRKRKFNNTTFTVIVLSESATDEVKNDLFERINKGSDILRNMETRKGIYRGAFTDFIYNECANRPDFRESIRLSRNVQNRQEYEELVLRFFALVDIYPKYSEFSRSVSKALDSYMAQKRDEFSDGEKAQKLHDFKKMIEFVVNNFEYGFLKGPNKDVSRIFFEAISVGCHLALKEVPQLVLRKKIDVQYWLRDRDFYKSVNGEYRTHSTENLQKRIHFVRDHILLMKA
ncbi:DUF262 domain-containing protein [Chromobacterium alticapitis]|uniref:DUF262 domain-containing protein n=1 Tax=Chromobacterium alticapitis TaxID=2073169 RepID=A0A2S5DLT0_9NEIS|nr:DUF262 domain-containing protein [Chromobacterium alticapitis]POZ63979.1 DUF262 domain-containing protein [Chromobacterium alticapitis]